MIALGGKKNQDTRGDRHFPGNRRKPSLAETVSANGECFQDFTPLRHLSPRNRAWPKQLLIPVRCARIRALSRGLQK